MAASHATASRSLADLRRTARHPTEARLAAFAFMLGEWRAAVSAELLRRMGEGDGATRH